MTTGDSSSRRGHRLDYHNLHHGAAMVMWGVIGACAGWIVMDEVVDLLTEIVQ